MKRCHSSFCSMIGFLIKLKERWENCKDPEKEILQKIRRFDTWKTFYILQFAHTTIFHTKVLIKDGYIPHFYEKDL